MLLGTIGAATAVRAETAADAPFPYQPPLPQAPANLGYATVAAALEGLHARPDVTFTEQDGWTIALDEGADATWSFAPPDSPAYPTVVKRQIVQNGNRMSIEMRVRCEAAKPVCDDLVRSFQAMNRLGMVSR